MLRKGLLLLVVSLASLVAAASAQASSPIEGLWSFNGGTVSVEPAGGGSFHGIVVKATSFSECSHPIGEEIWSQVRQRPDGSFWGLHQWYFAQSGCQPNPELGLTAFRLLPAAHGTSILKVCFSQPGEDSQPRIKPDGTVIGATDGCTVSGRVRRETTDAEAAKYIRLPAGPRCGSSRLRIMLRSPAGETIARVEVKLRSGNVRRRAKLVHAHGGIVATLSLRGLTQPSFVVTARLTTSLRRVVKRTRRYRLCGSAKTH
jgi:hypothetical protein